MITLSYLMDYPMITIMINEEKCPFCIENGLVRGTVLYEDDLWYYQQYNDGELRGGGMIITKRHIVTPFEINEKEWGALRTLLPTFKAFVDKHNPDGYNLGWNILPDAGQNVAHAHLHIFPRFSTEPLATKGIRYAFKQPSNKRIL